MKLKRLAFVPLVLVAILIGNAQTPAPQAAGSQGVIKEYCVGCHNDKAKVGQLTLESIDIARVGANAQTWEKVVRKVRSGMMPPSGAKRPARTALDAFAADLETRLDRAAAAGAPNPGAVGLHRLNRT